jgi:hypothetical protein
MKNYIQIVAKTYALISLLCFMQLPKSNAQAFYAASNTDISSSCGSTKIENTNNDYIESVITTDKRAVIVYDGTNPGLYWDDINGHTGHTALGSGILNCQVINPDVSLSSDGKFAIAVYQDAGNGDNIMVEVFIWSAGTFSYSTNYSIKLYIGGINAKIDGFMDNINGDEWMVVWNKDNQLAVFTTAGYIASGSPIFVPANNVLLQGNGISFYSAPDVSVLRDSVYYTYNEFDGTNNVFTVEAQTFANISAGILIPTIYDLQYWGADYAYDLPRLSSAFNVYYSYYDWAVVAQTPNSSSGGNEIHGFVKHWGNPVNTAPFVYNDGSLAFGTPNDISRFQNDYPVISYVGDYIFILWHVDPSGYSVSDPDDQDIIGVRMEMDGFSFSNLSEYYFIVNNAHRGDQMAPSISGRFAKNSNKYLAAFYNNYTGASNGKDLYYKQKVYNSSYTTLFRLGTTNPNIEPSIFPTPFNDELKITLPKIDNSGYSITITDKLGKQYFKNENLRELNFTWKPSNEISSGIYFIKIVNNQTGESTTQKISKL